MTRYMPRVKIAFCVILVIYACGFVHKWDAAVRIRAGLALSIFGFFIGEKIKLPG
jgi:hypothetical protein